MIWYKQFSLVSTFATLAICPQSCGSFCVELHWEASVSWACLLLSRCDFSQVRGTCMWYLHACDISFSVHWKYWVSNKSFSSNLVSRFETLLIRWWTHCQLYLLWLLYEFGFVSVSYLSCPPFLVQITFFPPTLVLNPSSCPTWLLVLSHCVLCVPHLSPPHSAGTWDPLGRVTTACTHFPHSGSGSAHGHNPPHLPGLWYARSCSFSVELFLTTSENALYQPHVDVLPYPPTFLLYLHEELLTSVYVWILTLPHLGCPSWAPVTLLGPCCGCLPGSGPPNDCRTKLFRKGKGNK